MLPTKDSGILYRTEYYDVLGSVVATLLMSQIHYWYSPSKNGSSKLRILREGKWWIAKSVSEWASECHLTVDQVKNGIKILKSKGLIETDAFMLGKSPVTHLRFLAVQGKGPIFEVPDLTPFLINPTSPLGINTQGVCMDTQGVGTSTEGVGMDTESITENTKKSTQTLQQDASVAQPPITIENKPGGTMAFKISTKGKALDSSKAILAKVTGKKDDLDKYQISPKGIYYLWCNLVPKFHEEVGCQKAFTRKQEGFVNRMVSLWSAESTRDILSHVIENWISFTKYAEEKSGAFNSPILPSIDFLYRYSAEAKNFWSAREQIKGDVVIAEPPKKKKLIIGKVHSLEIIKPDPVKLIAPIDPEDDIASADLVSSWKPGTKY